jgi:hypothetical protein
VELKLHQVGPLDLFLQFLHLRAQINVIDLEDVVIGILVGH